MENELVRGLRPNLPNHPELADLVFNCKVEPSRGEVLRWGSADPEPGDSFSKTTFSCEDLNKEDSPWWSRVS